jgi:hypothetical protein
MTPTEGHSYIVSTSKRKILLFAATCLMHAHARAYTHTHTHTHTHTLSLSLSPCHVFSVVTVRCGLDWVWDIFTLSIITITGYKLE